MSAGKIVLVVFVAAAVCAGAVLCASSFSKTTTLSAITHGLSDEAVAFECDTSDGEDIYRSISQSHLVPTDENMGGDRWRTITALDQSGQALFTLKVDSRNYLFVESDGERQVYRTSLF